ncbi:MAG: hypothetical protein QOK39_863 [Acidimicrobiaceae bacterium]|nr:hypothetical protein [Acidimicrobiaceae bacterium]
MTVPCGCWSGPRGLTPLDGANRAGLAALAYRVGTWSAFLQTMQERLSSADFPQLAGLTTRDRGDASVALLDGWAVVADVLTFYQERIANEGYLRTATERRSVLELARLLGYELRPGVAASVFLAFTIDKSAAPVPIAAGVGANSVPGPGEQMQTFETADGLEARSGWNVLKPRATTPQTATTVAAGRLYLQGNATRLKANDPLLVDVSGQLRFVHITSVEVDAANGWTVVEFPAAAAPAGGAGAEVAVASARSGPEDPPLRFLVDALTRPPSIPPAGPARLTRSVATSFAPGADAFPRLLASVEPRLQETLYTALGHSVGPPVPVKVYALRIAAAPFGHNAPLRLVRVANNVPDFDEWQIDDPHNSTGDTDDPGPAVGALLRVAAAPGPADHHLPHTLFLDGDYDVAPDSMIVIEKGAAAPIIVAGATQIRHRSLAAYGLTGKTVQVDLPDALPWIGDSASAEPYSTVRSTRVFAGSESLPVAEVAITDDVARDQVVLDDVYQDLEPGRWLIVAGERTDVGDGGGRAVGGIETAELVMLAQVEQRASGLAGDAPRTVITLAVPLQYRYKRDTVTIYGNVVRATHGQSRSEVLGSGDASQTLARFGLKQPPVTYVSASTPSGVATTLEIRVNDLLWHQAPGLADMGANDRMYVTRTNDDAATTVVFGTGERGARLPTGQDNVRARYRNGIGAPGNVKAGQISLLAAKPLGVKSVSNPMRASGGANNEGVDAGRANAPLAVAALDRLVSVQDYSDFARTFAGVAKAAAVRLSDGRRPVVHVTIAGFDDIPIDATSDLFHNLNDALHRFGDPHLPVILALRERLVVVVSARVSIGADYQWESVEAAARGAISADLSFDRRDLGRDVLLTDAVAAGQAVPGVDAVEFDVFAAVAEADLVAGFSAAGPPLAVTERIIVRPARLGGRQAILPAQIASLAPEVPATLTLQEWKL